VNDQLFWFVARAGGIVTWVLVAASVLWGLALSTKALGRSPRPNWILDLHRFLGGAAVVFCAVHVGSIMLDSYVGFGPVEVLVPLTGDWNPGAVAWGIIAMYLVVAVEITSLLRRRLSKRAWRLTHFLSFPLFVMGTVHTLTAGTDASNPIFLGVVWTATAAVAALTTLRVAQSSRPRPAFRSDHLTSGGRP
jgi:DMSO/TMAO reductase YedYZ heme-binding membrane subunit